MAQIVVEHVGADSQARCRLGSADQCRQRREQIGQVIGHGQGVVAQRLDLAGHLLPLGSRSGMGQVHPEAKRLHLNSASIGSPQPSGMGRLPELELAGRPAARLSSAPMPRAGTPESMTMALDERASVCTFDCPDTCSLTVTVEDEHIVKVRGSHAAPYTAGVICSKVAQGMEAFVHGPQRLLYPLRRSGPKGSGEFERVSWAAALDEIHQRVGEVIDRWGAQAVLAVNY